MSAEHGAKTGSDLQAHVFGTYFDLRIVLAVLGFVFPLAVIGTGWVFDGGLPLQASLSAYYWATHDGFNAARIPFVGGLFAVGTTLFIYRGFSGEEDRWLDAAGACAILVAVFPTRWTCEGCSQDWTPHGTAAVLLFVCLGMVAWRRAGDTLSLLPSADERARYSRLYKVCAVALMASPIAAFLLNLALGQSWFVLLAEWAGIWSFSAFWAVKTWELHQTQATSRLIGLPVVRGPEARKHDGQERLLQHRG